MNNLVIVSRHAGAVEWLRLHGIEGDVISHVESADEIRGKTVVGNLPFHLAAKADMVGVISMPGLLPEQRGVDLTPEQMDAAGAGIQWFRVLEVE